MIAGQSNPSSAGSASSRMRSGSGKGGGKASPGVEHDSWGAAEAEAALNRVKELEEQAAIAEHKRKIAEERAVQLSSESASLMRSNEEKQVLAKALEMQRSSREALEREKADMRGRLGITAAAAAAAGQHPANYPRLVREDFLPPVHEWEGHP